MNPAPRRPERLHCALAIMTKAPRSGKVKTRLVPPLTLEEAATLSGCFLRDTANAIFENTMNEQARGVAVYTPAQEQDFYAEILPAEYELVVQRGETFGERLIFAFEDLFQRGFAAVCLIDSDSPTLPTAVYAEAVRVLAELDEPVVLGEAEDGGYYLIGLKRLRRELFVGIEWSSEHVLKQTIEKARRMRLEPYLLPRWYDVDDNVSLHRLCSELFGRVENTNGGYSAPVTRRFLEDLLAKEGRTRIWPAETNC